MRCQERSGRKRPLRRHFGRPYDPKYGSQVGSFVRGNPAWDISGSAVHCQSEISFCRSRSAWSASKYRYPQVWNCEGKRFRICYLLSGVHKPRLSSWSATNSDHQERHQLRRNLSMHIRSRQCDADRRHGPGDGLGEKHAQTFCDQVRSARPNTQCVLLR